MSIRRTTVLAAFLLSLLPILPLLLGGCDSKPTEPVFDNRFDPNGPSLGNGLNVIASYSDTSVTVLWYQPQGVGIAFYEVWHSNTYGSGYTFLESVEHSELAAGFLTIHNPEPTKAHYFRVKAQTEDGDFTIDSYQTTGFIVTPPRVVAGDFSGLTPSRFVPFRITVSEGDHLVIADNVEFNNSVQFTIPEPGSPQTIIWELGDATANDEMKYYFVKALTGTTESEVYTDSLEVDFKPEFKIGNGSVTVATWKVTLDIEDNGVDFMRFALTEEALEAEDWIAGSATLPDFELLDTLNPQTIYGEFDGDFGFRSPVFELPVAGDPLTEASFSTAIPDTVIVDDPIIVLNCTARATQMRFSENPGFMSVPWLEYADEHDFELSAGGGLKIIYGQFRNEFADSPILTASVNYIEQSLGAGFLGPADGNSVIGGVPLEVRGWAAASAGADIDSVKVDLGDGLGFAAPDGLRNWSLLWDVPTVELATPWILRARAWADADSVTTQISITVEP